MRVNIYQINVNRDVDHVKSALYRSLYKYQDSSKVNPTIYDKIYESSEEFHYLEEIYQRFNRSPPRDFKGEPLSVSDIVEVSDSHEIEDGFYYCDLFNFVKIEFKKEKCEMNVEQIKETYVKGMVLKLEEMQGERQMPQGLKGMVKFVDDAGQIHVNWENGSSLALNVNEDQFEIVEDKNKISILVVETGKYPKVVEIEDSLEAMQQVVGGYIEEYMPFEDEVAIVCNEEGKISGATLNRAIYNKEGALMDVVAGKFFICYAPIESEKFQSLPKEMEEKYREKFKYPEHFSMHAGAIKVTPYKPVSKEMER